MRKATCLLLSLLIFATPLLAQNTKKKKEYHREIVTTMVGDVGRYTLVAGLVSMALALAVNELAVPDQYKSDNNESAYNQLPANLVIWGVGMLAIGYPIYMFDYIVIVPIKTGKHNPPLFGKSKK